MDKERYFERIKEYKLLAKHEVGQNFLIDADVCEKIVSLGNIQPNDVVLEIGPGAGSLSFFLAQYESRADLMDIDEALITKLKDDFKERNNINPIQQNALKADYSTYTVIIGNLPYYITSSLMEKIATESLSCRRAVLMVQKEAFLRLSAKVNTEDYGPLPIVLSYVGGVRRQTSVPRSAFSPAPHVDSTVFTIDFKEGVDFKKAKKLLKLTNGLFAHRRKTIYNNLSSYLGNSQKATEILKEAEIDPARRPENLTLGEYEKILNCTKDNMVS